MASPSSTFRVLTTAAGAAATATAQTIPSSSDSLPTPLLVQLLFFGNKIGPFLPTYAHLLITALIPIYAGAHASLSRPNNVEKPKKARTDRESENEEDEDDEEDQMVENLTAKDALLFPLTAGIMLGVLYLIIKYLKDPTLLSRILTYYFILMGLAAVASFYTDLLDVVLSFIFPRSWRQKPGVSGTSGYYIAGHDCYHFHSFPSGQKIPGKESLSPFPRDLIPLPKTLYKSLWSIRRKLLSKYAVVIRLGYPAPLKSKSKSTIRKTFTFTTIFGFFFSLVTIALYLLSSKHWIFTNILGVSFSYNAMRLISPTTFTTATLLLSLLFFYDIYFVFYTPLMVTVATNLDVPIKLLFPRPSPIGLAEEEKAKRALAMLGLGDVVLPGMMIGLALRFDFWKWNEARKKIVKKPGSSQPDVVVLPKYIKPTGTWGERFWNWNCSSPKIDYDGADSNPSNTTTLATVGIPFIIGGKFPKPYFYTSLVGYIFGMVVTLLVMHVFNHAQPALLYLVPAVLGSLWTLGVFRGEVKTMWQYSEVEEEDDESKNESLQGKKKRSKIGEKKKSEKGDDNDEKKGNEEKGKEVGEKEKQSEGEVDKGEIGDVEKSELVDEKGRKEKDADDESTVTNSSSEQEIVVHHPESESDIELLDENGEREYISVSVVKKPAFGARKRLRRETEKEEGGREGEKEKKDSGDEKVKDR